MKCKMIGDALGKLLKKPTVYSQEERSMILERNQDQNVARAACLQNLDQVHDEIESKGNAKRQSHFRTFEGHGGEGGAEKAHECLRGEQNLHLEERASFFCQSDEQWKSFLFKEGSYKGMGLSCLWSSALKGSKRQLQAFGKNLAPCVDRVAIKLLKAEGGKQSQRLYRIILLISDS